MKLSHRAMRPEDIPECVDIIAKHPGVGPRYGKDIDLLPEACRRLLQCEAKVAVVILAGEDPRAPICFPGISAIVRDDFLDDLKAPPHFWVGPELARRIVNGESPVLTGEQLRDGNSRDGLNLVCWEGCARLEYEPYGEVHRYMMSAFIEEHRGYRWKEAISSQSWCPEHLDFILRTGGRLWDPLAGGYTTCFREGPEEIVRKPHVLGITRQVEQQTRKSEWAGSWVGALFDYHPPKLGLSPSEQRMLSFALHGATDDQLAEMLRCSLPAIKKAWVSIYRRVEDCLPGLIPDTFPSETSTSGRGREKRRGLLVYLRAHPEELRPVSRTLLGTSSRRLNRMERFPHSLENS